MGIPEDRFRDPAVVTGGRGRHASRRQASHDASPLVETHRAGPHSREWIVRASGCPALAVHGIAHVGVADAAAPYAMVRTDLAGTYFLACVSGEGRIYLDGRWQRCGAGMACLAPPHVLHAFHAIRGKRWGFAWVRYQPTAGHGPLINSAAPVLARFPGDALKAAIEDSTTNKPPARSRRRNTIGSS